MGLLLCKFTPWISKRFISFPPLNREADQCTAQGKRLAQGHRADPWQKQALNWPLLTTVHWSSANVWNFISERVKSAAFVLCYRHEAVLRGVHSLLGDRRMSLQEQQPWCFHNSFLSTKPLWAYSLIIQEYLHVCQYSIQGRGENADVFYICSWSKTYW